MRNTTQKRVGARTRPATRYWDQEMESEIRSRNQEPEQKPGGRSKKKNQELGAGTRRPGMNKKESFWQVLSRLMSCQNF